MKPTDREWHFCACGMHALHVTHDTESDDFEMSIWNYGSQPTTIRQRLRHIWRIIRYGDPYADWVVLNRQEANQLVRALLGAPEDSTTWWVGNMQTTFTGTEGVKWRA